MTVKAYAGVVQPQKLLPCVTTAHSVAEPSLDGRQINSCLVQHIGEFQLHHAAIRRCSSHILMVRWWTMSDLDVLRLHALRRYQCDAPSKSDQ